MYDWKYTVIRYQLYVENYILPLDTLCYLDILSLLSYQDLLYRPLYLLPVTYLSY